MWEIGVAGVVFLATHFGLSSTPLRAALARTLGENGFLGIYSVISLATLGWLIWLFADLPKFDYLWTPNPSLYWLPKVIMLPALVMLLGGFMVKNPTTVGLEATLTTARDPADLAVGMNRITRHPFQWSVILWSTSHLAANGDIVSVIFFATFLVLSGAGTLLIDRKKATRLGEAWAPFASVTSNVPFVAILSGRNQFVPGELVWPVIAGLIGYVLLFVTHEWLFGAPVF